LSLLGRHSTTRATPPATLALSTEIENLKYKDIHWSLLTFGGYISRHPVGAWNHRWYRTWHILFFLICPYLW
jgi:hypothetical protein